MSPEQLVRVAPEEGRRNGFTGTLKEIRPDGCLTIYDPGIMRARYIRPELREVREPTKTELRTYRQKYVDERRLSKG